MEHVNDCGSPLAKLLICLFLLTLCGCGAPKYQHVTGNLRNEMLGDLQQGNLVLDCQLECLWSHLRGRYEQHNYYLRGQWEDLAVSVMKVGMEVDLAYFYLGAAAEGLGYLPAAKRYYERSLYLLRNAPSLNRCESDRFCNGISLPSVLPARINNLEERIRQEHERQVIKTAVNELAKIYETTAEKGPTARVDSRMSIAEVKMAQLLLKNCGYHIGKLDGIAGEKVETAVRSFQQVHGLEADGTLNEATQLKLEEICQTAQRATDEPKLDTTTPPAIPPAVSTAGKSNEAGAAERAIPDRVQPSSSASIEEDASEDTGRTPESSQSTAAKYAHVAQATDLLNAPTVFAKKLQHLPKNAKVKIITDGDKFFEVEYRSTTGFVYKYLLILD